MMRSMFTGVSGLRIHQTKMDVIAHNIANVNTVGYKSSRVTFSDVFSQTVSGASRANAETGRGGMNPKQIGLGSGVGSIDKQMSTGAAERTDRAFDLMIEGDGFFIVGDGRENFFTRAGVLDLDESGNLVSTATGMVVKGWDSELDRATGEWITKPQTVRPIKIAEGKSSVPAAKTSTMLMSGNLDPGQKERITTMDFYDSIGTKYTVDVKYELVGANWEMKIGNAAYVNDTKNEGYHITGVGVGTGVITFGDKFGPDRVTPNDIPPIKNYVTDSLVQLTFNTTGQLTTIVPDGGVGTTTEFIPSITINSPNTVPAADIGTGVSGSGSGTIAFNFKDITGYANSKGDALLMKQTDGNAPGSLTDLSVGPDGLVTGQYSNGQTRILAQIPIATFANPGGLQSVGNNMFSATPNSGRFDGVGIDVTAAGGRMMGGVLEMSNVDLAAEFSNMITTQRGFQSNSRIITTSDEMLQELVSMKR